MYAPLSPQAENTIFMLDEGCDQWESGISICYWHHMLGIFAEKFYVKKNGASNARAVQFMMTTSMRTQYRKRKNVNSLTLRRKVKFK